MHLLNAAKTLIPQILEINSTGTHWMVPSHSSGRRRRNWYTSAKKLRLHIYLPGHVGSSLKIQTSTNSTVPPECLAICLCLALILEAFIFASLAAWQIGQHVLGGPHAFFVPPPLSFFFSFSPPYPLPTPFSDIPDLTSIRHFLWETCLALYSLTYLGVISMLLRHGVLTHTNDTVSVWFPVVGHLPASEVIVWFFVFSNCNQFMELY